MRRVNASICYEGGEYEVTVKYISELAHMLNEEEPWDKMSTEEILEFLGEGLFANEAYEKLVELSRIDPKIIEKDPELLFLFNYNKNRVHTGELLRKVSKDRYGRDFDTNV